jgi:hypothetical protein
MITCTAVPGVITYTEAPETTRYREVLGTIGFTASQVMIVSTVDLGMIISKAVLEVTGCTEIPEMTF